MAEFTDNQGRTLKTAGAWIQFPPAKMQRNVPHAFTKAWEAGKFLHLPELITEDQFTHALEGFFPPKPAKPCKRCKGTGQYSYNPKDGTTCLACKGTGHS